KTLRLRRGDGVIIETWPHTLDWARSFTIEARKLGIRPLVHYEDETAYWAAVEQGQAKEVGKVGAPEWAALGKTTGYVFFWGPEDRARYAELPNETREALTAFNTEWYRRAGAAKVRAVRIEVGRATRSSASSMGVALDAWKEELARGSAVEPATLARSASRLVPRLMTGRTLTISHANGTELTLRLLRRRPVVDDGIVDASDVKAHNAFSTIPAGVVSVAVDEKSADGRFVANKTSYLFSGPATGGKWNFGGGALTDFSYDTGGERFAEVYEKAPAGKERPAFVSVGLNPYLRAAPRLEDQELGAVTLAIGANADFGGRTKIGFGSWLSISGAHLSVDGKPLVADGIIL
ncbi:MAG: hypothetical protein L3K09_02500, partial [Thermoplasmata archaeon]|nr:hypothetical protein [Thermoplasmata archaeon]